LLEDVISGVNVPDHGRGQRGDSQSLAEKHLNNDVRLDFHATSLFTLITGESSPI
jgi:hypothetical protein